MKVLYAIQATGNGHISRAREIIPYLQKKVDLDICLSGRQSDIDLPYKIDYRLSGMSYTFGKRGGINLLDTFVKADTNKLVKEIVNFPIRKYDFVINDFEPVTSWAGKLRDVPVISLSNQSALMIPDVPRAHKWAPIGKYLLKKFAPAKHHFGIYFQRYHVDIFNPVIRKEVRELEVSNKGHYTVYLPSYKDAKLLQTLKMFPLVEWEVFSKHNKEPLVDGNVSIQPIRDREFLESIASCEGVLCGAGFATTTEALYLGKKLAVIPMKNQYEQDCNAVALEEIGVTVFDKLSSSVVDRIQHWIDYGNVVSMGYRNETEKMIDTVLKKGAELAPDSQYFEALNNATARQKKEAEQKKTQPVLYPQAG